MIACLEPPYYQDLFGLPFERGARGPDSFDCYGLAREMFARAGVVVPDFKSPASLMEVADLISETQTSWQRVDPGTIGSLVTLRVEGLGAHVGYVIGRDRYIHTTEQTGVTTDRLSNTTIKPIAFYRYG